MANFLRIPTKLEYGLILMIFLARNQKSKKLISLESVSNQTGISQGYLEEIAGLLRKKGIIASKRGFGGGYILKKKPKDIKIYSIVEAITGPIWLVECLKDSSCLCLINRKFARACPSRNFWQVLQKAINRAFKKSNLSELV